jgi:hypothetical protein
MITEVVEMPDFIRRAKALMSDAERMELIDVLARDPQAGVSLGQGLYKARVGSLLPPGCWSGHPADDFRKECQGKPIGHGTYVTGADR